MIIEKMITDVELELYKEWGNLKELYKIKTDFRLCPTWEYIKIKNMQMHFDKFEKPMDLIIDHLRNIEKNGVVAETLGLFEIDENDIVHIIQIVCFHETVLHELILKNIGRIDLLLDFLKQSLRHEVGHVLSNIDLYDNIKLDELIKVRDEILHEQEREKEFLNEIHNEDDYLLAYFNLPEERMANERVGLTAEDMLRLDKEICKPCNINIQEE